MKRKRPTLFQPMQPALSPRGVVSDRNALLDRIAAQSLMIDAYGREIDRLNRVLESAERLEAANADLIAAQAEEIAAKDELLTAQSDVVECLTPLRESHRSLLALLDEGNVNIRALGIHFRQIADTARNIETAMRENDPRDAVEAACEALQVIIDCGDTLADAIAETAYTAIADQLSEGNEVENG